MTSQSNPIQVNVSTNFLYASRYKIALFDGDYQPIAIDYWTIRNYEVVFGEDATTMTFQIFGLQMPLNLDAIRKVKYVKIHFTDWEEKTIFVTSFEVTHFRGSFYGDYNSDSLFTYNIELALK